MTRPVSKIEKLHREHVSEMRSSGRYTEDMIARYETVVRQSWGYNRDQVNEAFTDTFKSLLGHPLRALIGAYSLGFLFLIILDALGVAR